MIMKIINKVRNILLVAIVAMSSSAIAENNEPDIREFLEPDINIINKHDRRVEEYRNNGRLYMVKVTPANGPAYYLFDSDGDGRIDGVPRWIIGKF